MNFNFITKVRQKKELTIKELAILTKMNAARIGKIERNKADPKGSELEKILKVLGHKLAAKDAINHYSSEEYDCVNENIK